MSEDLFSKIEDAEIRNRIFEDITKASIEIQIQLKDNSVLNIKSYKKYGDELIVFRELPNQPIEQDVIVTFNLAPEKYFLKSKLTQKNKSCHIPITSYFYKLQRRKNFRLTLPKLWEPKFHCQMQDNVAVGKNFDLYDLSNGGFSFEFSPGEFAPIVSGQVEGILKIKNRLELSIKATVKHSREVGSRAYPKTRIGLEIIQLAQVDEAQIMAVLMEVHREIFAKLK